MASQCDQLGIPKHLHKNGRGQDENFSKTEKLFRRINPDGFLPNGHISSQCLSVNDMSLNRGRYSKFPEDVLYDIKKGEHFVFFGIIEIEVGFVESPSYDHPEKESCVYTFKMKHEPEECMYPHSVLQILLNQKKAESKKGMPKRLRSLFRDELRTNCIIVKMPQDGA